MKLHEETSLVDSYPLKSNTGKKILLKMECRQPVGSFKIRGIGLLCSEFAEDGISHFVSSSGGNAGYAVAYAGRKLGVDVTVVVPEATPEDTLRIIRDQGAVVAVHGSVWDETDEYAAGLSKELNAAYIAPFDHPTIWRGHSTIIDEITGQNGKPDSIVLSVGGGGLLCGIVEGLQRNNWNDVPIVAVETEGAASFAASVSAGEIVALEKIESIAASLGAKKVTRKALDYTRSHTIIPHTVTDEAAVNACVRFFDDHSTLVEPACGASLSVVYDNSSIIGDAKTVVVIVCGGIGVSEDKLQYWQKITGQKRLK
jgi:L-serine/L-threonine ammonia-lyase